MRLSLSQRKHLRGLLASYRHKTRTSLRRARSELSVLADSRANSADGKYAPTLGYPLQFDRAHGCRIWDVDGNEYTDFSMGAGVHIFGHDPLFLVRALRGRLGRGMQVGPLSPAAPRAAAAIADLTGLERVSFCNSGTEAVMLALRLARAVSGRTRVVKFSGAYHGTFDGVMVNGFRRRSGYHHVLMSPGTPLSMVRDVNVLGYGEASALEYVFRHRHEIAAVLVEPIQNRNLSLQPVQFLRELRALTAAAGIALIWDEATTGFRVHLSGAQGLFGITADIATYGKVLGGGLPIGVVAGRAHYLNRIDGGGWAKSPRRRFEERVVATGTFSRNPLAMTAAATIAEHFRRLGGGFQIKLSNQGELLGAEVKAALSETKLPFSIDSYGSTFRFCAEEGCVWSNLLFVHLALRGIYISEGRQCFLSAKHSWRDCSRLSSAIRESGRELERAGFHYDSIRQAHSA